MGEISHFCHIGSNPLNEYSLGSCFMQDNIGVRERPLKTPWL